MANPPSHSKEYKLIFQPLVHCNINVQYLIIEMIILWYSFFNLN